MSKNLQHGVSSVPWPVRWRVAIALLLAVATLATYGPAVRHDFVSIDDDIYVTENVHVRQGLSLANLRWAFSSAEGSNYWHPLTWLSHMVDVELFGLRAGGHHFTSVLLHAMNTGLLFLVMGMLTSGAALGAATTGDRAGGRDAALWPCLFIAGLFGLHPLHVESVAWVAERKDVLSGLFWILTIGAYARYARVARETGNWKLGGSKAGSASLPAPRFEFPVSSFRWYVLTLFLFAFSLMSKPMAVTLPFVLLLLDWWPLRRLAPPLSVIGNRLSVIGLLAEKVPFLVLAGVVSVAAFRTQAGGGVVQSLTGLPMWARVANALVSYATYLGKTVWPTGLAVYYPHPGTGIAVGVVLVSGLALVVITLLVLGQIKRRPYLLTGWFWYLGTLVPVIGLVQIGTFARADRYTYLPLIGIFLMVAGWVGEKLETRNLKLETGNSKLGAEQSATPVSPVSRFKCPVSGLLLVLLICALTTRHQLGFWRDGGTLFARNLAVTGGDAVGHDGLGLALLDAGRAAEAEVQFRESIRLLPDYARTHVRLGLALAGQGQTDAAAAAYGEALRVMPDYAPAHVNLGSLLLGQGRYDEAVRVLEEALRIEEDQPEAHSNLAIALYGLKRVTEAIGEMEEAVRLQPDNAVTRNNLGRLLLLQGRGAEAIPQFEAALRLRPDYAEARQNLAEARERAGAR